MTTANPHRLYRDAAKGFLFGVCAGLAEYLGLRTALVRLVFFIGLLVSFPLFLIGYLLLAWGLKPRPEHLYNNAEEEDFWRSVSFSPKDTLHRVRHHFRSMDDRLRRMEDLVTSIEYELERKYKDLA